MSLIKAGNNAGAEVLLQAALRSGHDPGSALYVLGCLNYQRGSLNVATQQFTQALQVDANNANAYYFLGAILNKQGKQDEAQAMFRRALSINPSHASALAALRVATPPQRVAPPQSGGPNGERQQLRQPASAGTYDLYELLRQDNSALSLDTIAVIDQLRMNVRPRFLAHSGLLLLLTLWIVAVIVGAIVITENLTNTLCSYEQCVWFVMPPEAWSEFLLGMGAWLLIAVSAYVRVRTTRVVFDRGRLQAEHGVFHRTLVNIELWRVVDVGLHQTMLNRLTGDGTLILSFEQRSSTRPEPVRLTGIAKGARLREIYQQLLNLIFLLRSNPRVKGVIAY
jgi:hypothetical protein